MAQRIESRRGPGQRAGLDRAQIVVAALAVIDEHGVDGLTMRRLGTELGPPPMAVYSHFDNKASVVDAVVESEAGRMYEIAGALPTDPIDVLVAISLQLRRVLLEHPNLAPILAARPLPPHQAPFMVLVGSRLLLKARYPAADIPAVAEITTRYSLGCALHEAGVRRHHAETGTTFRDGQEEIIARLARSTDDTTVAQAVVAYRIDEDPAAATTDFERGLRALLTGLLRGPA